MKQKSGGRAGVVFLTVNLALQVFALTRKSAEAALGSPLATVLSRNARKATSSHTGDLSSKLGADNSLVVYEDLELGRIIGAGQFGLVRIAQHKETKAVYALKVCFAQNSKG